MPVVKIHVSSEVKPSARQPMVKDIRKALVDILGISDDHGHVILYESPLSSRCIHESRDSNFVFAEILMFSGRRDEMKEKLFRRLSELISKHTGVDGSDIILNIIETDRKNWAKGGAPISKIDLGY